MGSLNLTTALYQACFIYSSSFWARESGNQTIIKNLFCKVLVTSPLRARESGILEQRTYVTMKYLDGKVLKFFISAASCYVYGHNHIQTFDGVNYQSDAHGCTYPLALRSGIQVDYYYSGNIYYGSVSIKRREGRW